MTTSIDVSAEIPAWVRSGMAGVALALACLVAAPAGAAPCRAAGVGYTRRLSPKLNWRVQLNVKDAFQEKGLIPISYQPNGTVAAWRIVSGQSFSLTNTFPFT